MAEMILFRTQKSSMRADIQALRAVAVLAVVIYHIWPSRLTGGFMGVDVFFVISGYLMTLTIWKGIRRLDHSGSDPTPHTRFKDSISFLFSFYARRIIRLAPAATVLLLSVFATIYFSDNFSLQLATLPQIIASTLFMQNWFLADQAVDYLGADASATAVQHFWSLSVEEQFYMLWPLLLLIVGLVAFTLQKRRRERNIKSGQIINLLPLIVIFVFTACSFVYCLFVTRSDPALAYFATPVRIWELSLGGILVFLPSIKHKDLRLLLPWLGLVLIAYPVIKWGGAGFPGWHALIPTLGTALVIWGGVPLEQEDAEAISPSTFSVANLSRLRPAQFFGDLSYSLYLWHWPLIILAPIFLNNRMSNSGFIINISIFLLSTALAWLSYRFIESTTRQYHPKRAGAAKICAMGVLCLVLVLAPAYVLQSFAVDYKQNILQKTYDRATNPDDISFGARATQHRGEKGVPEDPFGQVDSKLAQFGSAYFSGTMDDAGSGSGRTSPFTYHCRTDSSDPTNRIGVFGDKNATKTILVLGDSYSQQWYPALDIAGRNLGYKVIAANSLDSVGSLFEIGDEFGESWKNGAGVKVSRARLNERFRWIRDNLWNKADVVVVGVLPGVCSQKIVGLKSLKDAPSRLASTFRGIQARTGKKVILIQTHPVIDRKDPFTTADVIAKNQKEKMNYLYDKMAAINALDTFDFLKVESLFLDDKGIAHSQIGGVPVYYNNNHISTLYSASAGEYITKQLAKLITAVK